MYGDELRDRVRALQLLIAEGAHVAPSDIQVQLYRDHVDLKVLDQLDQHFKQQTPIPEHPADSFTGFILSKPQVKDGQLLLHAMQCLDEQGQPSGEVWIKFKSAHSLTQLGKDLTQLDIHALQVHMLDNQPLPLCAGKPMPSGPEWLRSGIDLGAGLDADGWQLPALETPMDVPERFAGHLYLKLLTPAHPVWRGN